MFKSNLFMFLGLLVSCDKKLKLKHKKHLQLKSVLRNTVGKTVEVSESAKVCGQFHVFCTILKYFLLST